MKVKLHERQITNMEQNLIRGSSLPRFMICNGFVALDTPEQKDSEVAKEGTAFHEYVEKLFKGQDIKVASNGVTIDDDMRYYSGQVLEKIPAHAESEVEVQFDFGTRTHIVGHIDWNWEEDNGETLVVMDIKYGHRAVEVINNWQLIGYAIGLVMKKQKRYNKIKMIIAQPRVHHYAGWFREFVIDNNKASAYYNEIKQRVMDFEAGKLHLKTSEQCRYCPALGGECAASNIAFGNAIDVVLGDAIQDHIDDNDLARMLSDYERIKELFKIKYDALSDLATSRIKNGRQIAGFALEPSYGNRKWSDGMNADIIKALTGVDMNKTVMLSPAEAEKKKIDRAIIDQFAVKEFKGHKLKQTNVDFIAALLKQGVQNATTKADRI